MSKRGSRAGRNRIPLHKRSSEYLKERVIKQALDVLQSREATGSVQPRFAQDESARRSLYFQILRFMTRADEELPAYQADTRARDRALNRLVLSENLIASIINAASQRAATRGWILTGPERQINRVKASFHDMHDGDGWRHWMQLNAQAFYTSNLGYLSEIGFDMEGGRPVTMWHVDPTHARIGNKDMPMLYYPNEVAWSSSSTFNPATQDAIVLQHHEYIHGNSMTSIRENLNGAGFCAVERMLNYARMAFGVSSHYLEKLGLNPPKGFAILRDLSQQDVEVAGEDYEEAVANNVRVFKDLLVLEGGENSDIIFRALSQLPTEGFDLKVFIDLLVQIFCMSVGVPVSDVWIMNNNGLGSGKEYEVQSDAAQDRSMEFPYSISEQINRKFTPSSVNMEWDERNDSGDLKRAQYLNQQVQSVTSLINSMTSYASATQEPIMNTEQIRRLMVDMEIVDGDLFSELEDMTVEDDDAIERDVIVNALKAYPNERVVRYHSATNKMRVVYDPNNRPTVVDMSRRAKRAVKSNGTVEIEQGDIDAALDYLKKTTELSKLLS
jgi:hypothetical protein